MKKNFWLALILLTCFFCLLGARTLIRLETQVTGILPEVNGGTGLTSFPLIIEYVISNGAAGNNLGPILPAPRAGKFTKCKIVTKRADTLVGLQVRINKNGTNVFSSNPTVSANTAAGTVSTFTTLTSSPLSVAADDIFQIDIVAGTDSWAFTILLE